MRFTKFSPKTLLSAKINNQILSRPLHIFNPPRKEVVIGNNSALFATAASLMEHTKKAHPDIHIIKPTHWLDNVLPEYYDCTWGQTMYGLPKFARDLLHLAYPNHDPTMLITLGQFINLRQAVYDVLKEGFNVPIYEGQPSIEQSSNNRFRVKISANAKSIEKLFDEKAYYYSWYRIPRLHDLDDKTIPNRSASILYTKPRESAHDTLIILGSGLQTAWVERNFRKSRIICIKRPSDEIPRLPANAEVNYERIEYVNSNTAKIEALDKEGAIKLTAPELGNSIRGEFYEGIGYKPAPFFTENLKNADYDYIGDESKISKFVSTKNIPAGSLMEGFLNWIARTNNLPWGFEVFAYHADEFPIMLINAAKDNGIILGENYFRALEVYIQSLDNPPAESLQLGLMIELFRTVSGESDSTINVFSNLLHSLDRKRLKILDNTEEKTDNCRRK